MINILKNVIKDGEITWKTENFIRELVNKKDQMQKKRSKGISRTVEIKNAIDKTE